MKSLIRFLFFIAFSFKSTSLFAGNEIRIIPDSTGSCAKFEISRSKKATFKVKFTTQKGQTLQKSVIVVDEKPQVISINWTMYNAGIYYIELKNKKEKVKLLFIKS